MKLYKNINNLLKERTAQVQPKKQVAFSSKQDELDADRLASIVVGAVD